MHKAWTFDLWKERERVRGMETHGLLTCAMTDIQNMVHRSRNANFRYRRRRKGYPLSLSSIETLSSPSSTSSSSSSSVLRPSMLASTFVQFIFITFLLQSVLLRQVSGQLQGKSLSYHFWSLTFYFYMAKYIAENWRVVIVIDIYIVNSVKVHGYRLGGNSIPFYHHHKAIIINIMIQSRICDPESKFDLGTVIFLFVY